MRLLAFSVFSIFLASAAHAFPGSVSVGMLAERVSQKTGQVLSTDGFHWVQVTFNCHNGKSNTMGMINGYTYDFFRTNDQGDYNQDSAMLLQHDFSGDDDCLRRLEIIYNTKSIYKVMLMMDDQNKNVLDLRFCPTQSNDCQHESFDLNHHT